MIKFTQEIPKSQNILERWSVCKMLNDSHRSVECMGRIEYDWNFDLSYFPGEYEPYRLHVDDMITIADFMKKIEQEREATTI